MGQSNAVLFKEVHGCISEVSFNRGFAVHQITHNNDFIFLLIATTYHNNSCSCIR